MQKVLGNVALALGATLIGLLAAELALAVFVPESNLRTTAGLNIFRADPELGYGLRANVYRKFPWLGREVTIVTDGNGHRIPATATSGSQQALRLVVAGDSYVFGNEVQAEETFAQRAAELMGLAPVNLGVGGYSLDQSSRALAQYITAHADSIALAVLVVYVGNDLERGVAPRPPEVDLNGFLVDAQDSAPGVGKQIREWIKLNSRIAFYGLKVYRARVAARAVPASNVPAAKGPGVARARWIYDAGRYRPAVLAGHRAAFSALKQVAARAAVPVTVALLPEREQVAGSLGDVPNRMLTELLAEVELPVIDLLPPLRQAHERHTQPLYQEARFGHLSAAGHLLVAQVLADAF